MREKTKNLLNLSVGAGFLIFSLFLLFSLLSYNEFDNSLSAVGASLPISNKMGGAGAIFSDLFLQIFGLASYLFAALFGFIGISYAAEGFGNRPKERYNACLKMIMFVVFVLSSCGCAGSFGDGADDIIKAGGGIGYFICGITFYLNNYFLRILYALCIIFSLNILTDFDYGVFYNLNIKLFRRLFIIIKFIFKKIIFRAATFWAPKKIFEKISILRGKINERKNKSRRIIEEQDKKIEILKKYIKNNRDGDRIRKIRKEYELDLFAQMEDKPNEPKSSEYKIPPINLLENSGERSIVQTKDELKLQAVDLTRVLNEYKIQGKIISVKAGPIITLHEFEPAAGIKSSRVISSADDIARNLKVKSTRISIIPERNVLGIELPNRVRNTIFLRDILESGDFRNAAGALPIILGVNIAGEPVIIDLAKCPHLLIAGTTGSGKSVSINTMILSLLCKFSPDECKFIMIDPKILELSIYQGIPHLLAPVVSDPKKAVASLKWVVGEMESRYRTMSNLGVRNIYGYNEKIREAIKTGKPLRGNVIVGYDKNGDAVYDQTDVNLKIMSFIVVVVDEMADLMLTAGRDVEALVQRIAQMARAAGIHIIMSTQRPSTDIITGVIKANFPSRISFLVSSKIDSRVILGEQGAEQLLGFGDLLYSANGGKITRAHGPFISDKEIKSIIDYILRQGIKPVYVESILDESGSGGGGNIDITILGNRGESDDDLYKRAVEIIKRDKKISVSYVQRQLRIGYNKAANLIERMEAEGIITPASGAGGKRDLVE
ncbi:MAG: DNA translocase FtsK 4TM domain-containing protein [Rickettsiales bacterium]|jgi:S-DNA-T family DNA segregation ATPase FtsK/SpoIIIE|nr:DNA translocase FtsK 4TM domain-containing protein [Rickettsiales bacterium]